jgi:antitoxin FitA
MATVQIRNVPEAVHRIYRARAAAAGMSLQEYLRTELIRNAELRAPSELVEEVTRRIATEGADGFARISSADVIRADRESH